MLRSHGERREVVAALEARNVHCRQCGLSQCGSAFNPLWHRRKRIGRQSIIIGEPHHPEILGVASYCAHPLIFSGPEDVRTWLAEDPRRREVPITVVAQTTCIRELFESSAKILKKECTNSKIFDTICNATHKRNPEAAFHSGQVEERR